MTQIRQEDGIARLGRLAVEGLGFAWKKNPEDKPETIQELREGLTFRFRFVAGHTVETLNVSRDIFSKIDNKADRAYFATGLVLGLPFKIAHDTLFANSFSRQNRERQDTWGDIVSNNPHTYDVFPSRSK